MNNTIHAIDQIIRSIATIEFRTYQAVVAEKVAEGFNQFNSIMVESPTGSGKTIIALLLAKYMHEVYGYSIGWVAMRRNLLAQVANENVDKKFFLDIKLISMFEKNPPEVDFLIVDECHHDPTDSMVRLYGNIKPKKILGLTATPFRSDKLAIPFDQTIRETNIFQLIRDNFLSDFEHYSIEKWTPELVTNAYLSDRKHWGKSVMFFHTEAECREAEAILLDANVRCDVVTAKTNREQQLDEFDDDNLDILINMLILTEGFDCPNLETVFVRPSNKNATVQMCGRVLRKFQGIQKKIVQCQNTKHPFCNYAPSKYRYTWEDQKWIALNTNFRHELIKDQMISILSQCYVDKDTLDKISGISAYSRRQVDRIFQILEEEDKEEAKKIEMIEQKKRIDEVMSKILSMTPSQKSENSNSNVIQLDSRGYTLNEDLIACRWIAENVDVSTIARRLGRASTNIRYRYKDKIRGIGPIFAEKGFQGLYELYKLDYSEQDLIDRLISFERILINQ